MNKVFGIGAYCKSRALLISVSLAAFLIGFVVIALGTPGFLPGTLSYALLIGICILMFGFTADYLLTLKSLRRIEEKASPVSLEGATPEQDFLLGLWRMREEQLKNDFSALENKQKESFDFFSAWIHELKTPSAAARIIASSEPEKNKALLHELDRLDTDLERALFYIRSSSFSEDFLVRDIVLKELVDACIRDLRTQFISFNISFSQEGTDLSVNSDPLWLRFIFDQLIQNSLKYTAPGGSIKIYAEAIGQLVRLSVKDTGCGIPPADRSRIFRRGFTGENSRGYQGIRKSTGMGLFLASGLAGKLGHRLFLGECESGSLFHIDFPSWSDFHIPAKSNMTEM